MDMQRGDPHLASCWHGVWASLSSSQLVAWLSDQRLRATAPGHGTCRHSHHPTTSGRSPSIQHRHQKGHQRAEPPSAIGFSRADGSSLRSEILKPTFHCRGEWRERAELRGSNGGTWRPFSLGVVFLCWILGALLPVSPLFFLGRLRRILAETKAPSAGNFWVILAQQQTLPPQAETVDNSLLFYCKNKQFP